MRPIKKPSEAPDKIPFFNTFIYVLKVIFRTIATTNIIIEILPGLLEKDFVTNCLSDYSFKIIDGIPLIDNYNVPIVMDSLVGSIESDMGIKAT